MMRHPRIRGETPVFLLLLTAALLLNAATASADDQRGRLESVFPAPMPQWTAGPVAIHRPQMVTLGGTLTASRRYDRGNTHIDIRLYLSSPWIRPLRIVLDNPELISDGGAALDVAGNRALTSTAANSVRIVVVRGASVVEVEQLGDGGREAPTAYAAAVRYPVLDGIQSEELTRAP